MGMLVALRSFRLSLRSFGVTGIPKELMASFVHGSLLREIFFHTPGPSRLMVQKKLKKIFFKKKTGS